MSLRSVSAHDVQGGICLSQAQRFESTVYCPAVNMRPTSIML
jgi:hypothetical protein